jgi:hypothetical protein
MLIGFWNCRTVGKKVMTTYLNDAICNLDLDVIALQEIVEEKYDDNFFRKIDPGNNFFWKWVPSVGTLCGVRNGYLEVQSIKIGDHAILLNMWDVKKKFRWSFIFVYGPAHEELKSNFFG